MATPVLEAALNDGAWHEVHLVVRRHLVDLLADGPLATRVRAVGGGREELSLLRHLAPDAALLLSNSFGAAWRAWRARIPVRAGSALSGRRTLLTHALVPPTLAGRRAAVPTARLLRDVAGLVGLEVESLRPRLAVREELVADQRRMLSRYGLEPDAPYVLCCPGAAFGAAKSWPSEHFAAVLDALAESRGFGAVVTGGPGEEGRIEAVAAACRRAPVSLAAERRDLGRLKALVRGARLVLVGDSGPRWIAEAFDVPAVVVFGPNAFEVTAHSFERSEPAWLAGLECAPCLQRTCPLDHHRCMRDLRPAVVLAAFERLEARLAARSTALPPEPPPPRGTRA